MEIQWRGKLADDVCASVFQFAEESSEWQVDRSASAEYRAAIGAPALMIESRAPSENQIAVALAESIDQPDRMRIYNIVPDRGSLTTEAYNFTALNFVKDLRRFIRTKKLPISCSYRVRKQARTLKEIIPGKRCRALFESFLFAGRIWNTPTTTHPSDIEKLDVFICALHRYRSAVNFAAIEDWLVNAKKWPVKDAAWTCSRIETGLAVLRQNNRF